MLAKRLMYCFVGFCSAQVSSLALGLQNLNLDHAEANNTACTAKVKGTFDCEGNGPLNGNWVHIEFRRSEAPSYEGSATCIAQNANSGNWGNPSNPSIDCEVPMIGDGDHMISASATCSDDSRLISDSLTVTMNCGLTSSITYTDGPEFTLSGGKCYVQAKGEFLCNDGNPPSNIEFFVHGDGIYNTESCPHTDFWYGNWGGLSNPVTNYCKIELPETSVPSQPISVHGYLLCGNMAPLKPLYLPVTNLTYNNNCLTK